MSEQQQERLDSKESLAASLDAGDEHDLRFTTFFKPIQVLGSGSFGKVILGIDSDSNEELAIKVISKKRMGEEFIVRAKQEARFLAKLNHPCIVKFKRIEETKTRVFIAMEVVRGGSLAQLVSDKKRSQMLNESTISIIMKSIMQGLAYIHSCNIVHRDLKPGGTLAGVD